MLSKSQIVEEISADVELSESLDTMLERAADTGNVPNDAAFEKAIKNLTKIVLASLTELAQREIAAGNDFTVPGIAAVRWVYTKPQAKGARWKAGDEVAGFGGLVSVKETDSPEVKPKVVIKAYATPTIRKPAPKSTDKAAQKAFLAKKVGKFIAERKG